jgi:hypothetical protein
VREPGECIGAARQRLGQLDPGILRRRTRLELSQRRVEHAQERPALPQTSCEQHRKHGHAEQESRSQLGEVLGDRESLVVSSGS